MTNNEKVALRQAAERAQAASNAYTACVISQEEFLAETSDYRTLIRGPERVLALLAERDADKKRIAELEARTVSVKFDPIPMEELGNKNQGKQHPYMFGAGYNSAVVSCKCALENACAAAGIKLEVGE